MLQALPHTLGFVLPAAAVAGFYMGGPFWPILPIAIWLVLVPIADALAGVVSAHVAPEDQAPLERNPWFRAITWVWVPVQIALLAWAVHVCPTHLGVAISVGVIAGSIGLTFAHELIHRAGAFERALGEILLTSVSYTHFAIEHVHGHHRYVCTPRDPATARFGESIYHFIPRSVLGGLASAWAIEKERLRRRGASRYGPSNRMLRYALVQVLMYGGVYAYAGWAGVRFLAVQALAAIVLVETINYVEHYGLERTQIAPGRYERVMACHSWDSPHRITNWFLINLARHADHHLTASKRYQVLDTQERAPQLPAGYPSMFMLALVPPLWRRAIDPRVLAQRARRSGDVVTS